MVPLSTRSCLKLNKLRPILNGQFCHEISKNICLNQCPAGRVFQYRVGLGRVLDKIPGSGSGSGQVGVSKYMIGYFRVSFFLSGIYCEVIF